MTHVACYRLYLAAEGHVLFRSNSASCFSSSAQPRKRSARHTARLSRYTRFGSSRRPLVHMAHTKWSSVATVASGRTPTTSMGTWGTSERSPCLSPSSNAHKYPRPATPAFGRPGSCAAGQCLIEVLFPPPLINNNSVRISPGIVLSSAHRTPFFWKGTLADQNNPKQQTADPP